MLHFVILKYQRQLESIPREPGVPVHFLVELFLNLTFRDKVSVADPDPGSDVFLPSGSGIKHPGSGTLAQC
jgi:hypothetical protein